ncbi:MAG: radical SAM protein, partial [Terriglobia bacterium]
EPTRDWFPLSLMGSLADIADVVHGPNADWGQVSCSCHPNCGVGTALMVNKQNGEWAPVPEFLNVPGLISDLQKVTDAARGTKLSAVMTGLALLKHYSPFKAPPSLTLFSLWRKFDKSLGMSKDTVKKYGDSSSKRTIEEALKRRRDPWNFLFIAGMWFQDLFNYDFRRTEMCVIPYATQEGEISFCAYNTGVGWRQIIENMHKNATVAEWYRAHGKHRIYAKNKNVELENYEHSLKLDEKEVNRVRERSDDTPMTASEEERQRRKAAYEAAQVRKIYEELVLKKKPESADLVQIGQLAPEQPAANPNIGAAAQGDD